MKLITGCNETYYPRMAPFLGSIQQHRGDRVDPWLIGVGFDPPKTPGFTVAKLTPAQNAGAPIGTECIQHGSFLNVVGTGDRDVIMYCDGDLTMQRPIAPDEWALLDLSAGDVLIGYNGSATETLLDEARRLGPRPGMTPRSIIDAWGARVETAPIYNAGCMAATGGTWRRLYARYMELWPKVSETFEHQARQQWLISWIIYELGGPQVMPWTMHVHGHHGHKPGLTREGDLALINGRIALFRHYL